MPLRRRMYEALYTRCLLSVRGKKNFSRATRAGIKPTVSCSLVQEVKGSFPAWWVTCRGFIFPRHSEITYNSVYFNQVTTKGVHFKPDIIFLFFILIASDPCDSLPCLNGAACSGTLTSFQCICPPGWTGSRCGLGMSFLIRFTLSAFPRSSPFFLFLFFTTKIGSSVGGFTVMWNRCTLSFLSPSGFNTYQLLYHSAISILLYQISMIASLSHVSTMVPALTYWMDICVHVMLDGAELSAKYVSFMFIHDIIGRD